jgi:hypothetical protein
MTEINRTDILDRAMNIENLLSILITYYFFPGEAIKLDFLQKVLNDESASANYKRSLFFKCYPETDKKIDENIRRIFSIRNTFAHSGLAIHLFTDEEAKHPDPRKVGSFIDFDALNKELLEKEKDVLGYLIGLIDNSKLKRLD